MSNECKEDNSHKRRRGKKRKTTEQFIENTKKVHGDKYNYDKVNYIGSYVKVTIGCRIHGYFEQTPSSHLQGNGCPSCGVKIKSTIDQFIENARKVHGNRYNYDKVEYKLSIEPVTIVCSKHGDFRQKPNNHLQSQGCPSCSSDNLKLTTDQFVENARKVHGDRYNYDKVEYVVNHKPVIITCLEHGPFKQTPGNHLSGSGCPSCKHDKFRSTTSIFVERARATHGNLYSYENVEYKSSVKPVIITCLKHGDFHQTPSNHLKNKGCPNCKSSKGESAIRRILLKHDIEFTQQYSIPNQNNKFKYDFYLPKLNLIIEYHGAQHYIPVKYFGGEEGFNATKLRDSLKKDIAKGCGYKFLEIKYTHFSNLTEEEFEKRLLYVLTKTRSLVLTK